MAFPTSVNSQITDAVSQSNVTVLGSAPAQAVASLFQMIAQAAALSQHNAVANQQNQQQIANAVAAKCVEVLLRKPEPAKSTKSQDNNGEDSK